MKEKDIDKIFSEALQNEVEQTTPADWENFEKSLPADSSRGWLKYGLLGLIGLIALTGITVWTIHYFGSEQNRHYTQRETISVPNAKLKGTENTNDSPDMAEAAADSEGSHSVVLEAGDTILDSANHLQNSSTIVGEKKTSSDELDGSASKYGNSMPGSAPGIPSDQVKENGINSTKKPDQMKSKQGVEKIGGDPNKNFAAAEAEMTGAGSSENESAKTRTATTAKKSGSVDRSRLQTAAKSNPERADMHFMKALDGIIPGSSPEEKAPVFSERLALETGGRFEPVLFVGFEQNTVLRSSLHAGFMGQWHFSKWTAGAGIALKRSGTLNWIQSSASTRYGFQKYERITEIQTASVDLLSFPIKVDRRIGGLSHVFVGYSPTFVVNARQNQTVIIDGTPVSSGAESGYLYNTGAPDFISFFTAGYGYDLNEYWNLEVGINASFQKWEIVDKLPVGGFLRLNYRIK